MSIYSDIQTVLDDALHPDVQSYWKKKTGAHAEEYVVYTIGSDSAINADDEPLVRNANITVRYYFKESLLGTSEKRTKAQERADTIVSALESKGYSVPNGPQDIGDVDDIGYGVLLIECYKGRVV